MVQFFLFALVGCAAAVGHYGVLIVLSEAFAVAPVPASAAGFAVGGVISYVLNYGHVFRSAQKHLPTAGKFLAVALTGLAFNSAIMWTLAHQAGLHYLPSQVAATVMVMVWSFLANRYWTFADAPG
jgi:Predicted membrane protein